ncbi:MAG: hypothetical protein V4732_06640 [Pseudomonadota bacterium]
MNNHISLLARRNMILGSFGVLAARAIPSYAAASAAAMTAIAPIKSTVNVNEKFPAISPFMYGDLLST